MTGYQEVLTDPSYTGQLVTMTYPLIGNYGVNDEDRESPGPQVAGFIVREAARQAVAGGPKEASTSTCGTTASPGSPTSTPGR